MKAQQICISKQNAKWNEMHVLLREGRELIQLPSDAFAGLHLELYPSAPTFKVTSSIANQHIKNINR